MTVTNTRKDPYLSGVYAPVHEEIDAPKLSVQGELPAGLRGLFLRNGPNPMFEPKGRYHIFDGDGMLHAIMLDGEGNASYRNRWVRTEGLAAEERAGHAIYGGMANGDFPTPEETNGGPPSKNVANTNVIRHAGRILCLWEAGLPIEVTPALETIGTVDFGGAFDGPFTAHPKLDPVTGEMYAFGYSAIPPYLRLHVFNADGTLARSVDLDLPVPVMMHDFAITERHAVFLDAPAVFDIASFMEGGPMLSWKPELGTRFGVLDRDGDGSDVAWIETDPCYVFHFLNAFSSADGRQVTVDASRLPRMDIGLETEGDLPPAESYLHRFTIDLDARRVAHEQVAELPGDFPRVPAALEGHAHRYGYYASFSDGRPGTVFDSVTKVDFETSTTTTHVYGPQAVSGEAVFAPDPDGSREDDGWLCNYVTDRSTMTTDFVVLSASSLDEVARVRMPQRVPFGFHGNWMPATS
jgi:carotenoid cleavage dioxygenase-like enzyme